MPGRAGDALETDFEHQRGFNASYRPEPLDCRTADDRVDFPDLGIGQTRVGLRKRYQPRRLVCRPVPDRKSVVGIKARPPAVAGLRIDQYRIHRKRIELPLEPVAAVGPAATDTVGRIESLEHQALGTKGTRGLAKPRPLRPGRCFKRARRTQALRIGRSERQAVRQHLPAQAKRVAAQIDPLVFQTIEDHQARGRLAQRDRTRAQTADAGLHGRKIHGSGCACRPAQKFAIEHGAGRKRLRGGHDLGEPVGEQFLATRPQRNRVRPSHQLHADPVPLPFGEPVCGGLVIGFRRLPTVREHEGIGQKRERRIRQLTGIGRGRCRRPGSVPDSVRERRRTIRVRPGARRRDQRAISHTVGHHLAVGKADDALGNQPGIDCARLGERPQHELPRHTQAQSSREQLVEHKALPAVEHPPAVDQRRARRIRIEISKRQQTAAHPAVERPTGIGRLVRFG